jgi:hypothetical protein
LSALGSIENVDALFGFAGLFDAYRKTSILDDLPDGPSFARALRNIFRRRVFFYLAEFFKDFEPAQDNPNLKLLIGELKKYRRVQAYGLDQVISYLGAIDKSQPYNLAPLYETFVDSELFTTLIFLEANITPGPSSQWPGARDWPTGNNFTESLERHLENLLASIITEDYRITDNVKDESNVLWGLRLLYQLRRTRGENISIGTLCKGAASFHELITTLARRPISKRRVPEEKDLILETTPELRTLERTNLYTAINLIGLLPLLDPERSECVESVKSAVASVFEEYIVPGDTPQNVYFVCLRYKFLTEYLPHLDSDATPPLHSTSSIGSVRLSQRGISLGDSRP